jgi:hypothetical protein
MDFPQSSVRVLHLVVEACAKVAREPQSLVEILPLASRVQHKLRSPLAREPSNRRRLKTRMNTSLQGAERTRTAVYGKPAICRSLLIADCGERLVQASRERVLAYPGHGRARRAE